MGLKVQNMCFIKQWRDLFKGLNGPGRVVDFSSRNYALDDSCLIFFPHKIVWLKLELPCPPVFCCVGESMMNYTVYRARFRTERDVFREYFGHAGNVACREDKLGLGGVAWTRTMQKGSLDLEEIRSNIKSLPVALAIEAIEAAKAIEGDPLHVRGGPWLSIGPIHAAHWLEIQMVAKCKSLLDLGPIADELGTGSRLSEHLRNVQFSLPPSSSSTSRVETTTATLASASSASSSLSARLTPLAKAEGKAKAEAKASVKAKAKAKTKPPSIPKEIYKLVRVRGKKGGKSSAGHTFRIRHNILDGTAAYDRHKYGLKKRPAVRKTHNQTYYRNVKKTRKRPAAG